MPMVRMHVSSVHVYVPVRVYVCPSVHDMGSNVPLRLLDSSWLLDYSSSLLATSLLILLSDDSSLPKALNTGL